jgi:hypothetical protein
MVRTRTGLLVALFALAMAPALLAQDSMVGQDAPEFNASECVNKPEAVTMEQCQGEVVLIKYWGTR